MRLWPESRGELMFNARMQRSDKSRGCDHSDESFTWILNVSHVLPGRVMSYVVRVAPLDLNSI
jgi:hypothetical protein